MRVQIMLQRAHCKWGSDNHRPNK